MGYSKITKPGKLTNEARAKAASETWRFPVPAEIVRRCRINQEQLILVLEFDKRGHVYPSFELRTHRHKLGPREDRAIL